MQGRISEILCECCILVFVGHGDAVVLGRGYMHHLSLECDAVKMALGSLRLLTSSKLDQSGVFLVEEDFHALHITVHTSSLRLLTSRTGLAVDMPPRPAMLAPDIAPNAPLPAIKFCSAVMPAGMPGRPAMLAAVAADPPPNNTGRTVVTLSETSGLV
eukprot:scpid76792/ scgid6332/ 